MVKITETISTTERVPNLDAIYGPYQSITAAEEALRDAERNVLGATVGVIEDGKIKEYWYKENTTELVAKGGGGGGVDPEIEERVEDLEQNKVDKVNEVHKIIPQTPVHTYNNYYLQHSNGHVGGVSGYKVLEFKVEAGKEYLITGQTGNTASGCLAAFLNNVTEGAGSTGTMIGDAIKSQEVEENRNQNYSREDFTAPTGSTYLRVQQISSDAEVELYESKTINVVDDLDKIGDKVDELYGGSHEETSITELNPISTNVGLLIGYNKSYQSVTYHAGDIIALSSYQYKTFDVSGKRKVFVSGKTGSTYSCIGFFRDINGNLVGNPIKTSGRDEGVSNSTVFTDVEVIVPQNAKYLLVGNSVNESKAKEEATIIVEDKGVIGDINELTTTDKSNLVNAINEVKKENQ